jgi:Flp pilus assembly protein TadG
MCKVTASQIQADGKVIGTAIDSLAVAIQVTDPTLAANLTTAGNALIAVTSNWKTGDSQAILTDAEQAVIVVLNLIPVTSLYAPLVAIVFTALNLLIANSQTQPAQTGSMMADAHALLTKEATLNTNSPWFGKAVIKHHFLNPPRKDFESAWNAAATPLGVAAITV